MCDQLSNFIAAGYVKVNNFIAADDCKALSNELKKIVKGDACKSDDQCKSPSIYGAKVFELLLLQKLQEVEALSGRRLHPTYSYARLYEHGDILENHIDRESCEISVTVTLDFDGDVWPIYMGDSVEKSNPSKIEMNVGDAVLYRGMDKYHWREKYVEGKWQAQVFLHYVDADGPHAEWAFDKRKLDNNVASMKATDGSMLYRVFDDVLSPQDCDQIVNMYKNCSMPKEPPVIGTGEGFIDTSIRNVERMILPTYKELGGQLAAIGLSCNHFNWKFDITHANQAEFLIYPTGGRYQAHIDTFMAHSDECRKLTVLAFLNDDFDGGKFYLQDGHKKTYPPQSKGTIIVFPSFLAHGVEDINAGTRYSAVCWMVGKFFR